jgi:L-arabinose isomerase
MKADYSQLALRFGELFGLAQGMNLKLAHLTKQGIEFVLEGATTRAEVRFMPKVYTEGKVIVDAINDLTMVVQVAQYDIQSNTQVGGGKIELPYSTWFFEGDFS